MAHPDLWFPFMTLAGFVLGGWHLCWNCYESDSSRGLWGRRLGVIAVLCLGCTGLVAAGLRSPWLVPLGLLAGLLVVFMLWEHPEPGWNQGSK